MSDWEMLTDKNVKMLLDSIDLRGEFVKKLHIFETGLIEEEDRKWQLSAHKAYDVLSKREREVIKLRLKLMTFPHIAQGLGISVSSAKTYWRRALAKCAQFL